jgi:hypothetical protein
VSTRKISPAAIAAALVVTLLAATPAHATTIGAFSYIVDSGLGPIFTVEDFSGGAFSDVVIHLFDATGDTTAINLGVVDPFSLQQTTGDLTQTTDDLTALPFVFDRATLDLTYSLAGSLTLYELTGLSFSIDPIAGYSGPISDPNPSVSIDFEPAAPQPVPEPATILLVGAGALIAVGARRVRLKPRRL